LSDFADGVEVAVVTDVGAGVVGVAEVVVVVVMLRMGVEGEGRRARLSFFSTSNDERGLSSMHGTLILFLMSSFVISCFSLLGDVSSSWGEPGGSTALSSEGVAVPFVSVLMSLPDLLSAGFASGAGEGELEVEEVVPFP
jgi:hypothetical protein